MTDAENDKLDQIIEILKRQNQGLAVMAEQIQNLAAIVRAKMSPEPPLGPLRQQ